MSKRMFRQLDMITAFGRWLALLGIPLVAFLYFLLRSDPMPWPLLFAALGKAAIDAVPVVMLSLKFYPEYMALTFSILDSVFSLAVLYLGGPSMLFYVFVSVVATGIRFERAIGLGNGAALAVGHIVIALARAGFRGVLPVLAPALYQSLGLMVTAVLCSLLADSTKREPPLMTEEQSKINAELRRLQAASDRARASYEMAGMLSAAFTNPQKILEAVLDISTAGFDEIAGDGERSRERLASIVFLLGTDGLYIAASRGLLFEETELVAKGERGVLYKVLNSGEPSLLGNLAGDTELRQFSAFRRCRSAVCVPLRGGFEIYGAILFASPSPDAFNADHAELLTAVANQTVVALHNSQLYQELQEEKERIVEVVQEARTKLARDLHDGPTQSISAIAMRLNFARLLLDRDPRKVKDELFKLENLARRTTKEIRTMLFALRPVVLETQGLKAAMEQLVDKLQETSELPVTLEIDDVEDQTDVNVKAVAWFISQEALNNAKKHAQASNIWVRMYIRDECFITEVEDDGAGFDVEAVMADYDQRGSFGLLNLQERADLVNGRTTIQSALGKGTRITLTIPLSREIV